MFAGLPGSLHHRWLQMRLLEGAVSGMTLADAWGRAMKKVFVVPIAGGRASREA